MEWLFCISVQSYFPVAVSDKTNIIWISIRPGREAEIQHLFNKRQPRPGVMGLAEHADNLVDPNILSGPHNRQWGEYPSLILRPGWLYTRIHTIQMDEKTKQETFHIEHLESDPKKDPERDYADSDIASVDRQSVLLERSEEEKRLVRKIDKRLMPMFWVMYVLNYIDRTNIGNAKVAGMSTDLKLSTTMPSIFLPGIMFIWGGMTVSAMGINSYSGLVALRFCLGIIEAGFFPGVIFLMSCWYKPYEISKRLALFYSAAMMSGAFGGLLAGAITGNMDGTAGIAGWKWLFGVEGLATVVVSLIAFFVLPDFPHNTPFLNEEERQLAVERLKTEESDAPSLSHMQAFLKAVKSYKTWLLALGYMQVSSIGNHHPISGIMGAGTISYFFPTLMTTLGHTGVMANYYTVPIYSVVLVCSITVGFSADKFNEKPFHIMGCCMWAAMCFIVVAVVKTSAVRYAFIILGASGVWSACPLFLSYALQNFPDRESRAISIALINGLGNSASIYGSYIWPSTNGPQYPIGFGCTTAFITTAAIAVVINIYLQKRRKVDVEGNPIGAQAGDA
ncbi:Permease of the major facilitator superfamily [Phaffia rhodozyma]|uniref:Permease of the major facilitator superfamily n=1 Tax=Phaffia rhodozyma TaxID=264483 RepID=A0A0F7SRI8_PHARH|nr:Permease of the major facilitator superfamily [Phaffia rhodozyma]